MLATIGGVVFAFAAAAPTLAVLDTTFRAPEEIAVPLAHAIGGAALGSAQWLVLRRYTPRAGRWIAISAIASAALTVIWLPFFDVWYIPGHIRGLFNGAAEMTTVLRVIMTYGIATGWGLRLVISTRPLHTSAGA